MYLAHGIDLFMPRPDPFSGYAAWILPGLEYEIALKASDRLEEWDYRYSEAVNSLNLKMNELINDLN